MSTRPLRETVVKKSDSNKSDNFQRRFGSNCPLHTQTHTHTFANKLRVVWIVAKPGSHFYLWLADHVCRHFAGHLAFQSRRAANNSNGVVSDFWGIITVSSLFHWIRAKALSSNKTVNLPNWLIICSILVIPTARNQKPILDGYWNDLEFFLIRFYFDQPCKDFLSIFH